MGEKQQSPSNSEPSSEVSALPQVSQFLFRGFWKYSRRLVRRKFHALRIAKETIPAIPSTESLLVYTNHASWWDPLVGVLVNKELFPERQFRAPIDAEALKRYAILGRLGFFPVEQSNREGSRSFFRNMQAMLGPENAIYITPHGEFLDVRDRKSFKPGLAHVASRMRNGFVIAMAVEYVFWNESTPEILVQFGDSICIADHADDDKIQWQEMLETELSRVQTDLSDKAIARSEEPFRSLIGGRVGEGGMYDAARRIKSILTGKKFKQGHDFSEYQRS